MTLLKSVVCSAVLLLAVSSPGIAQQPSCPNNPQSPRELNPSNPSLYDRTSRNSIVHWTSPATQIQYFARPGCAPQTLYRCGQHYHAPVENTQGCPGETGHGWVEIHTVFAAALSSNPSCDQFTLECCKTGPFVVLAYSAKVTPGGTATPIVPPLGRPLAEWSGSTTNADKVPGECKPPAQWSFRLGCDFKVSEAQLKSLQHPDPVRPLQACNRLSRDLTKVVP